jgi:hypothetical protein
MGCKGHLVGISELVSVNIKVVPFAIVLIRDGKEYIRNISRMLRNVLKPCQSAESRIGALYLRPAPPR